MNQNHRRVYVCQECQARQTLKAGEFDRAARPRCVGCGSVRLEPATRPLLRQHDPGRPVAGSLVTGGAKNRRRAR